MTTRILVATAALSALTLAACSAQTSSSGTATPVAESSNSQARVASYDEPDGLATAPALMDCLVRHPVIEVRTENDFFNPPSALPGDRVWSSIGDHWGDWVQGGWFYVFADAATAEANAQAALAQDIANEEAPAETASAERFGNVVWVRRLALRSPASQGEQDAMSCLPGADPATALPPVAAGLATPGATFGCVEAIGDLDPDYEKDEDQDEYGGWGEIDAFYLDETRQHVEVHLFQDAASAEARRKAVTKRAKKRSVVAGNAIAVFGEPIDPAGPDTAAVLACLPG